MNIPLLKHSDAIDLLTLTMLIYDYGKNFSLKLNDNGNIDNISENENMLNETRKQAFLEIERKYPDGKIIEFISDEKTDLQVGITLNRIKKRICIIFRGSESKTDWYYDIQVMKQKLVDNIYVHQGFYNQLYKNDNYNKITNIVNELLKEYNDYQIYVTGHSLGAALSTLYGYQLSKIINQKIIVVSFASPRVGNNNFRLDFDKRENLSHYRFSNQRDIITSIPMFYYHHVGQNIQLFDDTYRFYHNYDYSLLSFSLFTCFKISEHDCELYYRRLLKNKW